MPKIPDTQVSLHSEASFVMQIVQLVGPSSRYPYVPPWLLIATILTDFCSGYGACAKVTRVMKNERRTRFDCEYHSTKLDSRTEVGLWWQLVNAMTSADPSRPRLTPEFSCFLCCRRNICSREEELPGALSMGSIRSGTYLFCIFKHLLPSDI